MYFVKPKRCIKSHNIFENKETLKKNVETCNTFKTCIKKYQTTDTCKIKLNVRCLMAFLSQKVILAWKIHSLVFLVLSAYLSAKPLFSINECYEWTKYRFSISGAFCLPTKHHVSKIISFGDTKRIGTVLSFPTTLFKITSNKNKKIVRLWLTEEKLFICFI